MIAFFAFISAAFVIWRAIWMIPGKRGVLKFILTITTILIAFKFQIFHFLGRGSYFAPNLPRWLLAAGALLYSIYFIFFFLLLFSELCRWLLRLIFNFLKRKCPEKFRKFAAWINPLLLAVAFTLATAGFICGAAFPEVRPLTLEFPSLPRRAENLKIVWLTDLHVDNMSDPQRLPLIVAKINSLEPDLILLGGDYVDGTLSALKEKLRPLAGLKARYGVFAIPGNHEYYSGFAPWMEFMEKECHITMLVNASHELPCGITLVGLGDQVGIRRNEPAVNFRTAFKDVDPDAPVILLAHRPELAHHAAGMKVMLQLSGHTHGGMIWGMKRVVKTLNGGFVSGVYNIGGTCLYVSNGTGIWSGFPIRLGAPSEITFIELKSSEKER